MSHTNLGIQVSDDGIGQSRKFCRAVCQRIEQGRPVPFDVLWLNVIVMRRPCREWRRHLAIGYHIIALEKQLTCETHVRVRHATFSVYLLAGCYGNYDRPYKVLLCLT